MRGCLIVGAAPASEDAGFYRRLLEDAAFVIAADGAGEWCAGLGRSPDLTVGDFDSAAPGAAGRLAVSGSEIVSLPVDKDFSDLDGCLAQARARGFGTVTFTAAFSERVDHTLAAIGTVLRATDLGARIEEPAWSARSVLAGAEPTRVDLAPGTIFTVVSPGGAEGVFVSGARYALADAVLEPLSSMGLSNVSEDSPVTVGLRQGTLLVVVQR